MKFLMVLIFILFSFNSFSQPSLEKLTPEDFLADFDLTVNLLKRNHPNPYKFISEKEFDEKVDSLRAVLSAKPDIFSFIACSPERLIRDIHIQSYLHDDLALELVKKMVYFPYPLFVENGRVFINIAEKEIPFGAEILTINNEEIKSILKEVADVVDGKIPSYDKASDLVWSISRRSSGAESYSVTFIAPGDSLEKTAVIQAIPSKEYFYRASKNVYPYNLIQTQNGAIYSEHDTINKTGILTVNSFDLGEAYAYKEFGKFFKQMNAKSFKKVIIDIRNNGGGDPSIAALLFSFLAKTSFSNVFNYKTGNITQEYTEFLVDHSLRKLSEEDILNQNSFFYQRYDKDSTGRYIGNSRLMEGIVKDFPRDKDAFGGEVRVLIGAGTISAATYFASLVKKSERGMLIGKETSSGVDATTAAWFNRYQLPKTRTLVVLPLSEIYFFNAAEDRGRGLFPDVQLDTGRFVLDVLAGKDPEMNYAIDH